MLLKPRYRQTHIFTRFNTRSEDRPTDNNGTLIYAGDDSWRRDELGHYLERLAGYRQPVYADSAHTRFGDSTE